MEQKIKPRVLEEKIHKMISETDIDRSVARIGVMVDCHLPINPQVETMHLEFKTMHLQFKTMRGNAFDYHGFKYDEQKQKISFFLSTKTHQSWLDTWGGDIQPRAIVGTTFMSYCWMWSSGSDAETINEVETRYENEINGRPVILGDLTQVLPSKFANDIIDCLDEINHGPFSDIIDQAIIYGPFTGGELL